jgi:hypothetical protein
MLKDNRSASKAGSREKQLRAQREAKYVAAVKKGNVVGKSARYGSKLMKRQIEIQAHATTLSNIRPRGAVAVFENQPEQIANRKQDEVALYDKMCKAIEDTWNFNELNEIKDSASIMAHASRISKNKENEHRAKDIRVRAERKLGEMLLLMKKNKGGRPKKTRSSVRRVSPGTLGELNITRQESHVAQKLAVVPKEDFDKALKEAEDPSARGIIRATAPPVPAVGSKKAVWLWNKLHEFDREYLSVDPDELLSTMEADMLDDVHRLAPRVAAWLKRIGEMA